MSELDDGTPMLILAVALCLTALAMSGSAIWRMYVTDADDYRMLPTSESRHAAHPLSELDLRQRCASGELVGAACPIHQESLLHPNRPEARDGKKQPKADKP